MTSFTTDSPASYATSGIVSRLLAAVLKAFDAHARHASRRDRIDALQAKSDAELARMGLTRDQIPHYVFRDLFYI